MAERAFARVDGQGNLVAHSPQVLGMAFLIMAAAAVTFVTIFWFRETYRASFRVVPSTAAA